MAIIVGNERPRIIGGIDTINQGKKETVIDPTEQNEHLKGIDEVEIQGVDTPEKEEETPVEEKKPAKKTTTRRTRKTTKK